MKNKVLISVLAMMLCSAGASAVDYAISLDKSSINFAPETYGYALAPSAITVTVTNTGEEATGALAIALSGAGYDSFTLSGTSLSTIAKGATGTFTVAPKTDLNAVLHEATVTVTGDHGINVSSGVKFQVNQKAIAITNATIDPKTYDGTNDAVAATVTFSGEVSGKELTVSTDYTMEAGFLNAGGLSAGTGKMAYVFIRIKDTETANNYSLSVPTYILYGQTVEKKDISIDDITKAYDKSADIASSTTEYTFSGLITDEELVFGPDFDVTGSFGDADAATDKTAAGTITLKNSSTARNYNLTNAAFSLSNQTISKKEIAVTPNPGQGKVVGEGDPELTYTYKPALLTGDDFTGALAYSGSSVGEYDITIGTLAVTANYELKLPTDAVKFAIVDALSFSQPSFTLGHAIVGSPYTATVPSVTGTSPVYSAKGLPSGLAINKSTGEISGAPSASGVYNITVTATNAGSSAETTASLVVGEYPELRTGLKDAIVCAGENHTFTVDVKGYNLSYEWYRGGERIAGAIGNSYTITNAESGNSDRYYAIVRTHFGTFSSSVYSKEVRLWVTSQLPANLQFVEFPSTVITGETYRFKLAGYSDVTKYSWSYDRDGVTFSPEAGGVGKNETQATFGVLSEGEGTLTVTLEHPCGTQQVTKSILVQFPTGVEQVAGTAVRVFPNPTAGIIHVSGTKSNQFIRIS
ncbi:MAG: putative Ig domain-containing protein, partial [Dysgonamonadaceae bacterium]|nr:putative Ig domain-containing protein [Dysgonamonadaceae bacterium]